MPDRFRTHSKLAHLPLRPSPSLHFESPDRKVLFDAGVEKMQQAEFPPSEVRARLSVCKPVAWQGRGDRGSSVSLVIHGDLDPHLVACLALGLRVFAVAIEQDPVAAERAAQSFPNVTVVSMQFVEEFRGKMLVEILRRRTVEGVIIGGGSPCQGNSALNRQRRGLGDLRSHPPSQLARIAEEVANLESLADFESGRFWRTLLDH